MSLVKLTVTRRGDNLFVSGLPDCQRGTHYLIPGLTPQDREIDPGSHVYIKGSILDEEAATRLFNDDPEAISQVTGKVFIEFTNWDTEETGAWIIGDNIMNIQYDPQGIPMDCIRPDGTVDTSRALLPLQTSGSVLAFEVKVKWQSPKGRFEQLLDRHDRGNR